ncbi:tRNA guanosine(34) transglycosylase Tgt [Patescibacteria group bacterium]|nr:tRNA guanosine(34) transglycosylase Tgt [Patescibacteria group bacterium]MBU1500870.1 tRNA guanosine(34) transglycosylase Tgt [Patescibacteria group bacterium]MBU2080925.1 tRNA guanosine(34) transglycosylase Tgt [Patescibacteria group bacterium]MBU2124030.1 tRNA guanosine(34) transglycosylase Tgt [Patescibacteria group bacterium]MBU2194679.1 tRNA guanosine(34) transglycosylase Tgt [Patescibacteria group bacterium]
MRPISFKTETTKGTARTGILSTPHGDIQTPAFVPVGTKAGVKGILPEQLLSLGAQVVLANTYHLYLQPGESTVKDGGGLGNFMGWSGPTMTDSGGFQVFSLGAAFGRTITKIAKGEEDTVTQGVSVFDEEVQSQHGQLAVIDEQGVTFTSHLDGSLHRFTPERSVEIQHSLGADMFFAFDECTSPTEPYAYQKEAMERTHKWAERSLKAHRQNLEANRKQGIFGIVQGGRYEDLRTESAKEIASMDFDGFGIGGSFSKEDMMGALQAAVQHLPKEKPRHFLGIGEPGDLLLGIAEGMDTFDCVAATRLGRHGTIYTKRGPIHLKTEKYKSEHEPLDTETIIPGTEGFSRAYVSHLLRSGEMLGQIIASLHNLGFIIRLVDEARAALHAGNFDEYRRDFVYTYYGRTL